MKASDEFYIVNAFTAEGQNGNPAGVRLNADGLSDDEMLAMAAEAGLSETAFVLKSNLAARRVRFFTPTVEEPLCGHATIATWALLRQVEHLAAGTYTQETQAGLLRVEIQESGLTFMEQTKAGFFEEVDQAEIAPLLGVAVQDFHPTLRPQIASTGIKDLLVPVGSKSTLARLRPKLDAIAEFSRQYGISGLHVFVLTPGGDSLASARNFAPADGIPEECATGTSNGALLCYLKRKGLLPDTDLYRVEQGEAMGRLSYIFGMFRDEIVWIGGEAKLQEETKLDNLDSETQENNVTEKLDALWVDINYLRVGKKLSREEMNER